MIKFNDVNVRKFNDINEGLESRIDRKKEDHRLIMAFLNSHPGSFSNGEVRIDAENDAVHMIKSHTLLASWRGGDLLTFHPQHSDNVATLNEVLLVARDNLIISGRDLYIVVYPQQFWYGDRKLRHYGDMQLHKVLYPPAAPAPAPGFDDLVKLLTTRRG